MTTQTNTLNAGVPSTTINLINAEFEKIFSKALMTVTPDADFVQVRTTRGKYIDLAGLLQTPQVRIWKDQKRFNSMNFVFNPVAMAPLEASIFIDEFDMMGDVVGLYGDAIASLAAQGKFFTDTAFASVVQSGWASEYTNLVQNGDLDFGPSNTIFGDNVFLSLSGSAGASSGTGHVYLGTNVAAQPNVVYGELYDPLTWRTAVGLMESYVGDKGTPMKVMPQTVVCTAVDKPDVITGLAAKFAAVDARPTITSTDAIPRVSLDNTGINTYGLQIKKVAQLYNNPGVAYLLGQAQGGILPVYQYMLQQLHLTPSVSPTDASVFYNHRFEYSMTGFGRQIIPLWHNIIRIVSPTIAKYQ